MKFIITAFKFQNLLTETRVLLHGRGVLKDILRCVSLEPRYWYFF